MDTGADRQITIQSSLLGFPYVPGLAGGKGRVLLGLAVLAAVRGEIPGAMGEIFEVMSRLSLHDLPSRTIDPLGYALGICPLLFQPSALTQRIPKALGAHVCDCENWNPIFVVTICGLLEVLGELCENEAVEGTSRIEDPTVVHRIWQQTLHLRAPAFSVLADSAPVRKIALLALEERHPGILKRVHKNAMSPEIVRRSATVTPHFRKWLRHGCAKSRSECVILREILSTASAHDRILKREAEENLEEKRRQQSVRRPGGLFTLSAMPPPRCIGRAIFESILTACKAPSCDGSACVAMILAGFLHTRQISEAVLTPLNQEFWVLKTSVGSTTGDPSVPGLHIESGNTFARLVPTAIGERFEHYRATSAWNEMAGNAQKWIHSIHPKASVAKLRYCLRFNAPVWFGYSPLSAELGLNPYGRTY